MTQLKVSRTDWDLSKFSVSNWGRWL